MRIANTRTATQLLKDVGSPFQKTSRPDGQNLYLEEQVIKLMEWYAEEVSNETTKPQLYYE